MRRLASVMVVAAALLVLAPGALAGISNPNDPFFAAHDQWGLAGSPASINAPPAWCVSTGRGILIADIDSGADFSHPDLAGKLIAGDAFLNGNGQPSGSGIAAVTDDNGHGSMTTGIMVAGTNNGVGIASVAPDAKALIIKVLDSNGNGNDADVGAAIDWAVDHGANVINLSLGADVPLTGGTSTMSSAIDYAYNHNVAVALAAGNNSLPMSDYQFSQISNEALIVGALGPTGAVAYYSTSGMGVNLYAPGGDDTYGNDEHGMVLSTHFHRSYAIAEGTSFAAPHAAGVLALLMAHGYNAAAARQRILDTVDESGGLPKLDAARALGATGTCAAGANTTGRANAPVPVPQRIGTSPLRANAPVPSAARHTAAPTAKASVSVSTPEPTPAAPRVIAAATPRPASNTQHPWALIAAACFAAAMAAALIFFASFTRR